MSILEVKGLRKVYTTRFGGNQVEALRNVSFSVEQGEYVAVMGESGSGKTTLLNILAALDKPTAGSVVLDGRELSKVGDADAAAFRRDNLGFVFQEFNLLDTFSLEDNIALPLVLAGKGYREINERLMPVARRLGIAELLKKYPYEVSGGQKQRAAVARAIITRPSLLLADEPTGALDSRSSDELLRLFGELNRGGQTIVMVTHDPRAASYADRVLVLADGRITQDLRHPTYQEILKVFASDDDMNTDAMDYGAEDSKSADGKENARIAGTQVGTHDADAHESNIEPTSNVDVPALVSPKLSIPKAEPFDARIGGNGAAA